MERSFCFVPYFVVAASWRDDTRGVRRSMLTKKQHELLLFIHRHLQRNGVSPSFDEMKDALDLRSKSGIHRLITGLEERGFIRRLPHRARALEVLRLPDQVSAKDTSKQGDKQTGETTGRRFTPNVI